MYSRMQQTSHEEGRLCLVMKWHCIVFTCCLLLCVDTAAAQSAVSSPNALRLAQLPLVSQLQGLGPLALATSATQSPTAKDAGPSLVPPLVTLFFGGATTLVGVGMGVVPSINCAGRCEPSGFASGLVVGGLAIVAIGLLWFEHNADERDQVRLHQGL